MDRHLTLAASALLATALLTGGCAKSAYGPQMTNVHYYEQCYRPVKDLRADEHTERNATVGGGVAGALVGALVGGLATGKVEGALVGAVAGGATGAVAGNVYGRNKARQQDAAAVARYAQALGEDASSLSRANAAARVSIRCYNEQFNRAKNEYRAGRMTKEEFRSRYEEIRSGLQEVSFVLQKRYDNMAAKDAEYEKALHQSFAAYNTPATTPTQKKAQRRHQQSASPIAKQTAQRRAAMDETKELIAQANSSAANVDKVIDISADV